MDEIPLIGVYIKSINFFGSLFLSQPSVEGYLVDKTTEECIKANSSTSNLYSYKNLFTLYQKEIEKK